MFGSGGSAWGGRSGGGTPARRTGGFTGGFSAGFGGGSKPASYAGGGASGGYAASDTDTGSWWGEVIGSSAPNAGPSNQSLLDMLASSRESISGAQNAEFLGLLGQLGYANGQYGMGSRNLNNNYGLDMQALGLRGTDINSDRELNALRMERLGLDRASLGLDREGNQIDRGHTQHLADIANRLLDNRLKSMTFEAGEKARGMKSDATSRGALFAPGYRQDQTANYLNTLSAMDRERLGAEREQSGYAREMARLNLADRGIGLKEQGIGLSERELGVANQRLDTMSASLGIDKARLTTQLQQGLEQLGLDRQMSINEVIARAGEANGRYQGFYTQLLNDIIAMSVDPAALMQSYEYQQNPGTGTLNMP